MDFNMLNNLGADNEQKPLKQINRKKLMKTIGIIIIVLLIITMIILYVKNVKVREFFDKYIFRKEVYENNLDSIALTEEDNNYSYAFSKYIVVLNNNVLDMYNSSGKKEHSLAVEISNPIFDSNDKYLVIAEKNGQKIYVVADNNILWQSGVKGNIENITINKNGYVSVVTSDISYKTAVITYDSLGNELFTQYLAATYAIDIAISEDNKFLAIAQANFSGSLIQSSIEIISIEKKEKEYTYNAESNKLIINIEYQDKNKLICMYDNCVHIIENNESKELTTYDYKDTLFVDINLKDTIAQIQKTSSSIFDSNSEIKFTNISNNTSNTYELGGTPKAIYSCGDITAVNLGTEAIFVKTNGWLSKRYKSNQEIQNIIITQNMAGIVYKNKIEIIKL